MTADAMNGDKELTVLTHHRAGLCPQLAFFDKGK
jgi:hypothetical protein